jgi:large subunit ribosomal protein L23
MARDNLLLIPRLTDKTYALSKQNVYVFNVPKGANKNDIAAAVATQYSVTVEDVNIIIVKGKAKQTVRRGKAVQGRGRDVKKAYITLAEGSKIAVFEEEEQ